MQRLNRRGMCVGILLLSVAASSVALAQPAPPPPACTAEQEAEWEFIARWQLGADISDVRPDQRWIGPYANRKKGASFRPGSLGGRNWFPASVQKQVVCGGFVKFNLFHPAYSGRESDFHIYLQPAEPFAFAVEDLEPLTSARDIYGETTLPHAIRKYPPWWKSRPRNLLSSTTVETQALDEGDGVCMYGPWVLEEFHDMRPEIHPAEHFWFRDSREEAPRTLHWFAAHDASTRFDLPHYYCSVAFDPEKCVEQMPKDFQPWAPASTWSVARVAYELPLDEPTNRTARVRLLRHSALESPPEHGADAIHITGAAGTSTLEFTRYTDAPLAISEAAPLRCTSDARDSVLGYLLLRLAMDHEKSGTGFAHVSVHGDLTGVSFPEVSVEQPVPVLEPYIFQEDRGNLRAEFLKPDSKGTEWYTLLGPDAERERTRTFDGKAYRLPGARLLTGVRGAKRESDGHFETEIFVRYDRLPGDAADPLPSYLNAVLYGHVEDGSVKSRRLYADIFGGRCFEPKVSATLDDKPIQVVDCDAAPAATPFVCRKNQKLRCGYQFRNKMLDLEVHPGDAAGRLAVSVSTTDPFGTRSDEHTRYWLLPLGRSAIEADGIEAGLLREAEVLTGDDWGDLAAERSLAYNASTPRPRPWEDATGCDARRRLAQLFWLMGRTYSRDGAVTSSERGALLKILDRFKETVCREGADAAD